MEKPENVPEYIWKCPVYFDWTVYKGETYFGMLNYERSIKARRPMIDLAYCATRGINGTVLKTVAYSKKHFSKSKLANQPMKITKVYYHQGKFLMLPEGEWPIHIFSDHPEESKSKMFQDRLTSAIERSVPFEDQEAIQREVQTHFGWAVLLTDGIYTIPPTEVEIGTKNIAIARGSHYKLEGSEEIRPADLWIDGKPYISKRVARIKDEKLLHIDDSKKKAIDDGEDCEKGPENNADVILAEQNAMMIVRFLDLNDRIFHYLTYNKPDKTKMTYNEYETILEQITYYRSEYGKGKPVEDEKPDYIDGDCIYTGATECQCHRGEVCVRTGRKVEEENTNPEIYCDKFPNCSCDIDECLHPKVSVEEETQEELTVTELLIECDDLFCMIEDYEHGKTGKWITELRGKIQKQLKSRKK